VREPLTEAADIAGIPALTAVEDKTSREVQRQYEESPYRAGASRCRRSRRRSSRICANASD